MSDEEKKERNTDKKRIDRLEKRLEELIDMLYSLKSAIGLPDHVLPGRNNDK